MATRVLDLSRGVDRDVLFFVPVLDAAMQNFSVGTSPKIISHNKKFPGNASEKIFPNVSRYQPRSMRHFPSCFGSAPLLTIERVNSLLPH